ncbi:MAG TPA: GerMN domain-containing protein [Spirochaetia bacterium]|nr:GerMN domain-containing protein [Spirochaetia bacterium]
MKQKRSQLGCLFWVALILLVLVVVLFNRPRIDTALKSMGLNNLTTKHTPATNPPVVTRAPETTSPKSSPPATVPAPPGVKGNPVRRPQTTGTSTSPAGSPSGSPSSPSGGSKPAAPELTTSKPNPAPSQAPKSQEFELYFVKVDGAGVPTLTSISRPIDFVDSPLTKTFDSLLTGVTSGEREKGLISLIPTGTSLLDARIANGTAYLNFSDRFRFNSLGREGYDIELKQVVFTATQFPTVQRVQILLDGKVRQFLGPEGVSIGNPLDRKSFSE